MRVQAEKVVVNITLKDHISPHNSWLQLQAPAVHSSHICIDIDAIRWPRDDFYNWAWIWNNVPQRGVLCRFGKIKNIHLRVMTMFFCIAVLEISKKKTQKWSVITNLEASAALEVLVEPGASAIRITCFMKVQQFVLIANWSKTLLP